MKTITNIIRNLKPATKTETESPLSFSMFNVKTLQDRQRTLVRVKEDFRNKRYEAMNKNDQELLKKYQRICKLANKGFNELQTKIDFWNKIETNKRAV